MVSTFMQRALEHDGARAHLACERDKQRSSGVIRGPQGSSEVLRGNQRQSEVIRGHQRAHLMRELDRQSEAIRGPQRSSEGTPDARA